MKYVMLGIFQHAEFNFDMLFWFLTLPERYNRGLSPSKFELLVYKLATVTSYRGFSGPQHPFSIYCFELILWDHNLGNCWWAKTAFNGIEIRFFRATKLVIDIILSVTPTPIVPQMATTLKIVNHQKLFLAMLQWKFLECWNALPPGIF